MCIVVSRARRNAGIARLLCIILGGTRGYKHNHVMVAGCI